MIVKNLYIIFIYEYVYIYTPYNDYYIKYKVMKGSFKK